VRDSVGVRVARAADDTALPPRKLMSPLLILLVSTDADAEGIVAVITTLPAATFSETSFAAQPESAAMSDLTLRRTEGV